ncbi:MAG: FAD-binding oxidoreductase, partial [Deltaproteobacteria bacterium]|nr:FAD-binding oxidoreductase [Deltaproteobacteria bacterium]
MDDLIRHLTDIVTAEHVLTGDAIGEGYTHDEVLTVEPNAPEAVVRPNTSEQVSQLLRLANDAGIPVTARGSGTGLSGACIPSRGGILLSFERMNRVVEIDTENHVAVVEPGVTLAELDEATSEHGLIYPIFPGESSASLGGNIATNAGGMRAVKYGVTRHHVLGLEAVLADGQIIQTGGKLVKVSSGYDLTQLIIGSEGTLALVTRIILKLLPRLQHRSTLLVAFEAMPEVMQAVPKLVATGVGPLMVEYIDKLTMVGMTRHRGIELAIDKAVQEKALAYLLMVVEGRSAERVEGDVEDLGQLCLDMGALEVFVMPTAAADELIEARERTFWVGKESGLNDIIDVVVPRAEIPKYMEKVRLISQEHSALITGCGHAGDGNIHLGVFKPEPEQRSTIVKALLQAAV